MKLVCTYSKSHERMLEEWFLPTLHDEFELSMHRCDVHGTGRYMDKDWSQGVIFKCERIIDAIRDNRGEVIVYSDVDIQFFGPIKEHILRAMIHKDIVCQLDTPRGRLCSGFFAVRANDATLALWREVRRQIDIDGRDQLAFNRVLRKARDIRFGHLPRRFFGTGTFLKRQWREGQRFYIPEDPLMYHANWAVGIETKQSLLRQARRVVDGGRVSIFANNLMFFAKAGLRHPRELIRTARQRTATTSGTSQPSHTRPVRVSLDAATVCQLKCPACPTANGSIAASIGGGLLSLEHFAGFVRDNPWIKKIELSNWGEVFLNPELPGILEHAHERAVAISVSNGANLNAASDESLEALVKYGVRKLTCSIDGASRDTYAIYRKRGDYDRVIANVKRINEYKNQYNSPFPRMSWQFVVFGHNEHEIEQARKLAESLNMKFVAKLSWDDLFTEEFSPVRDRDTVKAATALGVSNREEYEQKYGVNYAATTCMQLWNQPRINYDGRLLGCSINHWDDFGNVFENGLESCLAGEKIQYAKAMLRGEAPARPDIPCTKCKIYAGMQQNGAWVKLPV